MSVPVSLYPIKSDVSTNRPGGGDLFIFRGENVVFEWGGEKIIRARTISFPKSHNFSKSLKSTTSYKRELPNRARARGGQYKISSGNCLKRSKCSFSHIMKP